MKIAINTLALYQTKVGMGKYIVELVNKVPKQDANNNYMLYVSKSNKHFFNTSQKNVCIKEVPSIFAYPFLKICWEQIILPFSLWKNNINLYHATGFVLPFFKPRKLRYIVTIADMTFFSHSQHHTFFKKLYFQCMIPHSLKKADTIITISENTKKDILRAFTIPAYKIKTIYLGIDAIFMKKNKAESERVLKKYNISSPYILFVGMLEPRKNIEGLIQAFSAARKDGHKLVIVGKKGWLYENIFRAVKKLGMTDNVLFTGYVPDEDLPFLYTAATCFVYPSFYEGFGIPILEAMACNCPVITSNNSSMQEIAGNAALLIDPYNIQSITKAIETCISDKLQTSKMIKKGFIQVKKYSWDSMAKETILQYNQFS